MTDASFAAAAKYCSCIQKGGRGGIRANSEEKVKQLVLSNFTDSTAKKHGKYQCKGPGIDVSTDIGLVYCNWPPGKYGNIN